MRLTWQAKVRATSLDHLYMVERRPEGLDRIPPHPLWQSPFVLAPRDESWEGTMARVLRAGELWLMNYDFRPHNELVIAHVERAWFMAFQRAARPDEGHIFIGPIERRVLRPADAQQLWGLPICFREAEQPTGGDLWRQLARQQRQLDSD